MESSPRICDLMEDLRFELQHRGTRFFVRNWRGERFTLSSDATHFGFVASGSGTLTIGNVVYPLVSGSYFSVPGYGQLDGVGACGFVVSQMKFKGLFHLGGPVEQTGRLKYIDGCSDTLLVPPVSRGDACLNLLCLPANTNQTAHTHPSFRVGVVASGHGQCITDDGPVVMSAKTLFALDADFVHSFHTTSKPMRVVAFHPDSDFGPCDHDHPMINRTDIDGLSAADALRAKSSANGMERSPIR